MGNPGFFTELRRRHVFRVAIAYAVTAWLLLQLAAIVLPAFGAPHWVLKVLIGVFVLCFPLALMLAWAFEMTPAGVRRTVSAEAEEARPAEQRRRVGRVLNVGIIVVLVAAVGILAWRQFGSAPKAKAARVGAMAASAPAAASAVAVSEAATAISPRSIAVLPFENLSADKNNEYFAAGMQDLILTKLADIGTLKVISRTSTALYASHPEDLKRIGEQLGVASILEGSVQKAGDQVLINVQLIDTQTDMHIWAQAYTRRLDNVFGVEGEVAEQIASALKAKLSPGESASLVAVPTQNQTAYDLFLRAEYQANRGATNYDTARWKAAIPLYRQAVEQDPEFALAWARLSYVESQLAWFGGGGEDVKQLDKQARADAERAVQLQPNLAAAQLALGYCDYYGHSDYDAALKAFSLALKLKPNDADALAAQAFVERRLGRFNIAIASLQRALTFDPRNSKLAYELGATYMLVSRYLEAENAFQRALALEPNNLNAKTSNATAIVFRSGDIPRALAAAQGDEPALKLVRVNLLTLQRKYREALALLGSVPDTPDNFKAPKVAREADLYWLMGERGRAGQLYAQVLPRIRTLLEVQQGINRAFVWNGIADAELGLGHTADGLHAIAKAQAIVNKITDQTYGPSVLLVNAQMYAKAVRPDLAVPLLAKALSMPGIGADYSPVMLWLDPLWDPIRQDASFQTLLNHYTQYKPGASTSYSPN